MKKECFLGKASPLRKAGIAAAIMLSTLLPYKEAIAEIQNSNAKIEKVFPIHPNLEELALSQILNSVNNSFDEGFKIEIDGKSREYCKGKIILGKGKCTSGQEQPLLYLLENNVILKKLYFSRMEDIKGSILKEAGDITRHIIFSYYEGDINNKLLPEIRLAYYDLILKNDIDNAGVISGYFLGLSEAYPFCEEDKNEPEVIVKIEKESVVEKIPPVKISEEEIKKICAGDIADLNERKIESLEAVYYPECLYLSEDSNSGLEELVEEIESYSNEDCGVLLFCGNADLVKVKKCSPEIKEGRNFALSFYRAENLADFIENSYKSPLKNIQIISYPNSTQLNERSVHVYFITAKGKDDDGADKEASNFEF